MEFSLISRKPLFTDRRCRFYNKYYNDFDIKSKSGFDYNRKYEESLQDSLLESGENEFWDLAVKVSLDFKKEEATPWLKNLEIFRTKLDPRDLEEVTSKLGNICGGLDEFWLRIRLSGNHLEDHVEMETILTGRRLSHIHDICLDNERSKQQQQQCGAAFHEVNGKTLNTIFATSFQWFVSVDLLVSHIAVNKIHSKKQPFKVTRYPVNKFDATIVANDGAIIKCDKNILSAQSQYFASVFGSDMQEGITSTVQLSYVSEAGVRALLAYLYNGEITEVSRHCSIAVELQLAADMYCIQHLGESIHELILEKNCAWFSVSDAVNIFRFNKLKSELNNNPEIHQQIEKKVFEVLKSKTDDELKGCEDYLQLFVDPEYGVNLFTLLLRNYSI